MSCIFIIFFLIAEVLRDVIVLHRSIYFEAMRYLLQVFRAPHIANRKFPRQLSAMMVTHISLTLYIPNFVCRILLVDIFPGAGSKFLRWYNGVKLLSSIVNPCYLFPIADDLVTGFLAHGKLYEEVVQWKKWYSDGIRLLKNNDSCAVYLLVSHFI